MNWEEKSVLKIFVYFNQIYKNCTTKYFAKRGDEAVIVW
jgi:hypothetical protein